MRRPAKQLPVEEIRHLYESGLHFGEISEILASPKWDQYWIAQGVGDWRPSKQCIAWKLRILGNFPVRNASERAIDRHPAKKPWPLERMKSLYEDGLCLEEIAELLASDDYQPYWIGKIGEEYRPGVKIVNKVLKKYMKLRRRGARTEKNVFWNGGRLNDRDGYVLVYLPDHPHANWGGYAREHRLVMEGHIGRYLLETEVVHHRNHIRHDNRIENLELFQSNSDHMRIGHAERLRTGYHSRKRGIPLRRRAWWPLDMIRRWYVDNLLCVSTIAALSQRSVPETLCGLRYAGVEFDGNKHRRWDATAQEAEEARLFLSTAPDFPEPDVPSLLQTIGHSTDKTRINPQSHTDAVARP